MKRHLKKKLKLNRETISQIDDHQLGAIHGGESGARTCYPTLTCPTGPYLCRTQLC